MARSILIVDNFAPETKAMRACFDERFANPRSTRDDRFMWDYWHVPGQYTALRTPAWTYFPQKTYTALHKRLVQWGRTVLGCHDISPPWLSCYVDGCSQQLHGDLPHGPWAFVLSLTHWQNRVFAGGETILLRDEVLDYWSDFVSIRSVEEGDVVQSVEPKFNRLVVFDPRIPHGVRTVRGTHDPRFGRLVLHGWFVQPQPLIEGPIGDNVLRTRVSALTRAIEPSLGNDLPIAGLLSLDIRVSAAGTVREVKLLSDTTRVPARDEKRRQKFVKHVRQLITHWTFPKQKKPSRITLPLVFEQAH